MGGKKATRRVRFQAEWVEELPVDASFAEGDRVRCEHRELTVTGVGDPDAESANTRGRRTAYSRDLRGADLFVELAPSLTEPGSMFRVECLLALRGRISPQGTQGFVIWEEFASEASSLGETLDAVADWAKAMKRKGVLDREVTGWARLRTVEAGARVVDSPVLVKTDLEKDRIVDGLEWLCEEAERKYGDVA